MKEEEESPKEAERNCKERGREPKELRDVFGAPESIASMAEGEVTRGTPHCV